MGTQGFGTVQSGDCGGLLEKSLCQFGLEAEGFQEAPGFAQH